MTVGKQSVGLTERGKNFLESIGKARLEGVTSREKKTRKEGEKKESDPKTKGKSNDETHLNYEIEWWLMNGRE